MSSQTASGTPNPVIHISGDGRYRIAAIGSGDLTVWVNDAPIFRSGRPQGVIFAQHGEASLRAGDTIRTNGDELHVIQVGMNGNPITIPDSPFTIPDSPFIREIREALNV